MDKKKIIDNASWIIGCKLVKAVLTLLVTILYRFCILLLYGHKIVLFYP